LEYVNELYLMLWKSSSILKNLTLFNKSIEKGNKRFSRKILHRFKGFEVAIASGLFSFPSNHFPQNIVVNGYE